MDRFDTTLTLTRSLLPRFDIHFVSLSLSVRSARLEEVFYDTLVLLL